MNGSAQSKKDDDKDLSIIRTPEESAALRQALKNAVLLSDPVTKLFIQYSLYLLIFSMALLSTTLPLALTNVLLLIVMSILVWRALASDT